ncbi:hypothetical protein F1640_13480 [Novosphingobium sp. NBM11]|uniref:hypothetical protein n=1 Tax=Novosphingobium sp. NBM11 TaxID=2596914 RepID=UPI0018923899|nr:hypothetical protein [Novosphingobium sp. NBM11]MBF5091013.1 hypothetical protein [Novosphingobium sp. NBM11]
MNNDSRLPIADARVLAAMRAVNPPIEKLMTDRLSLRIEVRRTQQELEAVDRQITELRYFREVQIPRYIAVAKLVSLAAASILLVALINALFFGLIEVKITGFLLASLILPLWITDQAERAFGRWRLFLGRPPMFFPASANI